MKSTIEILRDTRAALQRNGWTQGGYIDEDQHEAGTPVTDCRVDLGGAIRIATTGDPTKNDSLTAAEARWVLLRIIRETSPMGLASWNDQAGRTIADVYALLDTAIGRVQAVSIR